MEIPRWILIIPLLCLWLICTVFNWSIVIQALRNKFTGKTERVPSMMPLIGGISLILVANIAPSFFAQSSLPVWIGVLILLLDPGSIPYVLLFIFVLPLVSVWRGFAKLINRSGNAPK